MTDRSTHIIENLSLSNYNVRAKYKSRIDSSDGVFYYTDDGVKCPHCGKQNGLLEDRVLFTCECGLLMTAFGNRLQCELPKKSLLDLFK